MNLFTIDNITAGYHTTPVLFDISLTIRQGDFIGIIGPNGAGKTTLIRLLTRILKPFKGTILYKEHDVTKISPIRFARDVAAVTNLEYMPPYTVKTFIALGRYPHTPYVSLTNKDYEIITNAMRQCAVEHLQDKRITQLSSGELQRTSIARALAQSTHCIMLDEPVSHLDIYHAYAIMDILKKLNENGSTIITILHDINIASEYCSRIIGIKNGNIFFDGKPEECITYQNIEALFDCVCLVYTNPISGKPYVYPVPEHVKKSRF